VDTPGNFCWRIRTNCVQHSLASYINHTVSPVCSKSLQCCKCMNGQCNTCCIGTPCSFFSAKWGNAWCKAYGEWKLHVS
jgi:hypothetical protein